MKRHMSCFLALCIIAITFCGCQNSGLNSIPTSTATAPITTSSPQPTNVFLPVWIDYVLCESLDELVSKSEMIFFGTVKNISFAFLDADADRILDPTESIENTRLYTIYEIQVTTLFKGTNCGTVTLVLWGGSSANEYEEEQLQLLDDYNINGPILVAHNTLAIGEEYLFTLKHRNSEGAYFVGTSGGQVCYHRDGWEAQYSWEYNAVLDYFGAAQEE